MKKKSKSEIIKILSLMFFLSFIAVFTLISYMILFNSYPPAWSGVIIGLIIGMFWDKIYDFILSKVKNDTNKS